MSIHATPAGPAIRGTVADAILAATYPPEEWPDGPPGEGEMDTARQQADAVLAALAPNLDAADRLRERLRALVDGWDAEARSYRAWQAEHAFRGDRATERVTRARAEMTELYARELRAALEET